MTGKGQLCAALALLMSASGYFACAAEAESGYSLDQLAWSTEATQPARFVAAHGRRSAIFGYSENGLECWIYPTQIVTSLNVGFSAVGTASVIDGRSILRRVIYAPDRITRIYSGPDFIVRETLFAPVDEPGALLSYEVEGPHPLDVVVRFTPVLDLMWPAAIGGQQVSWSAVDSAYVLSEPLHRYAGLIGSPDVVAHDETPNLARPLVHPAGLALTIRAAPSARLVITGGESAHSAALVAHQLLTGWRTLQQGAATHYADVLRRGLQIQTPDPLVNRAFAWSQIALDQAWVCNPDLGCGLVAGYGPSRGARRPQYDWFFAGDGLVSVRALLAAGRYEEARQELEFILKYQDRRSGMIWHELTQSAARLDWRRYPYMFVHVDITFDFLTGVADYYRTTGDLTFVRRNWGALQQAFEYCRSVLDPRYGLPRIPPDRQGHNEQDVLGDELTLSAGWVTAAEAYATLAEATGHVAAARVAAAMGQRARNSFGARYWDSQQQVWISGHSLSGRSLVTRDSTAVVALQSSLFSPQQRALMLDQLSGSDFQTDWGARSQSSSSPTYQPNAYASGSVWALGTGGMADSFWAAHRSVTALQIWRGLLPWFSLDSLGHLHETLAGDYYHEEQESVPEQTWSSAAFLTTTIRSLSGLRLDGATHRIDFVPHLPPDWNTLTVRNVSNGGSSIGLELTRSMGEIKLLVDNQGPVVTLKFSPELPLGAHLTQARVGDQPVSADLVQNAQDTHATVELRVPKGRTSLAIGYDGGVLVAPDRTEPNLGNASEGLRITGLKLSESVLTVELDHFASKTSTFELRTPWAVTNVTGAELTATTAGVSRLVLNGDAAEGKQKYEHGTVAVKFARP